MSKKKLIKNIMTIISNFLIFFLLIAFVVTCTFLLFFDSVSLPEEDIRRFAPIIFQNVIVLTVLFYVIDLIRRKLTVEIPAKKIQDGLQKIKEGDFSTRLPVSGYGYNKFSEISESINHLAEELSGVETLRTDFISNVSHELKTPIAVMQNYATMLKQPGLPEQERMEYATAVMESCKRLSGLVTNILKLNKLENQQIFPMNKEYNLTEQLCQCLLQYEDVWEKKNIAIDTQLEDNVIINSDETLLELVWNNLLSNAFKFTEEDGTISVKLKTEGNCVKVSVRDTGCGMPAEIGARIFEKFYQGDTSHATQGNGLGLALVKRVVDIIQGEIAVESTLGKGTQFTVTIWRK